MRKLVVAKAAVWEDGIASLMARVEGAAAANITQATVSSIGLNVFNQAAPTVVVASAAPVVASTVFDTLQTDARWTRAGGDATGYNFRYQTVPAQIPDGGKTYRFQFSFVMTSGDVLPTAFELDTKEWYGS